MKNSFILSIMVLFVILLSFFVFYFSKSYHKLKKEKEVLILKSDSLHILQLQTDKELSWTQNRLDSLLAKNKKRIPDKK